MIWLKITAQVSQACGRLFLCLGIMLAKHVTKTKESPTQCKHCDKVTDGEHKQVPPTKISQRDFYDKQRSQSSVEGLTAYR